MAGRIAAGIQEDPARLGGQFLQSKTGDLFAQKTSSQLPSGVEAALMLCGMDRANRTKGKTWGDFLAGGQQLARDFDEKTAGRVENVLPALELALEVLVEALSFALVLIPEPFTSAAGAAALAGGALSKSGGILRHFGKALLWVARVMKAVDRWLNDLVGKVADGVLDALGASSKRVQKRADRLARTMRGRDPDLDKAFRETVDIGEDLADVVIAICLGVRRRGHACFPAGTLVTTSQGLLPIEEIQRGMHVLGRDAVTGEWGYGQVEITFAREYKGDLLSLQIGDETVTSTPGHPFWVSAGEGLYDRPAAEDYDPALSVIPGSNVSGRWVLAGDLCAGDVVVAHMRGEVSLEQVSRFPADTTVYNFHVTGLQSYVVGCAGVWVHNNSNQRGIDCSPDVELETGDGNWVEVARRPGDSLDIQSDFSGRPIQYRDGKAYIEEYKLDGVYFDRLKNGVLGDVKADYGFAPRVLEHTPNLKAIQELLDEARRQIPVARKYGLPLEWHVRRQDHTFFENVLGDLLDDITLVPY